MLISVSIASGSVPGKAPERQTPRSLWSHFKQGFLMWLIKQITERSILDYYQITEKVDIPELHSIPEPEGWGSLVGGRWNRSPGPPSSDPRALLPGFLLAMPSSSVFCSSPSSSTPPLVHTACTFATQGNSCSAEAPPRFPQEDQNTWFISFPPLIPFALLCLGIICDLFPRAHCELPADSSPSQEQPWT